MSEWEPPQTKVGWRSEVAEITEDLLDQYKPEELLEDYPIKSNELLTDRSDRIFNTLKKLAQLTDIPVWVVDDLGAVEVTTLSKLVAEDKESINGMTVLLPPSVGGPENGLLAVSISGAADDVADEWRDRDGPLRKRLWQEHDEDDGMKLVRAIDFPDPDNIDGEPLKTWFWYVRVSAAEPDAKSSKEYDLQLHLDDAKHAAEQFVSNLPIDGELKRVVVLAAEYHDLGKDRDRWQRGIGNIDYPAQKWAKSGKRQAATKRSYYRHEFGSTLDVRDKPEFKNLSPDAQELVLHLIAAHHGRARPHFTADEALDDKHTNEATTALAIEAPRRFFSPAEKIRPLGTGIPRIPRPRRRLRRQQQSRRT